MDDVITFNGSIAHKYEPLYNFSSCMKYISYATSALASSMK